MELEVKILLKKHLEKWVNEISEKEIGSRTFFWGDKTVDCMVNTVENIYDALEDSYQFAQNNGVELNP